MFSSRQGFIYAGNPPAPSGGDPYWADNHIYLDGESIADTSDYAHSVTNYGVTTSTTQVKYGTSSLYFDGSSRLEVTGTDVGVDNGDFTLDMWVYHTSVSGDQCYVDSRADGSTFNAFIFFSDADNGLSSYVDSGYFLFQDAGTINVNTWHHIAMSRSGSTTKAFIDGVEVASASDSINYYKDGFTLGAVINGGAYFVGYIDNVRLTKGVARYTADFTPPSASDYGP